MFARIVFNVILIVCVWARSPLPDKTTNDFENESLKAHNYYRSLHNTSPLTLDSNIINYAKSRCNSISQYEGLSAGHSGLLLGTYGENLYWGGSTDGRPVSASNAIKAWYDEIQSYSWSNPTFSSGTGHFTQVLWKDTTKLGCAQCGGRGGQWYETYIVCNYVKPGNVLGEFGRNVMPPSGKPSQSLKPSIDSNDNTITDNNSIETNTNCRCDQDFIQQ